MRYIELQHQRIDLSQYSISAILTLESDSVGMSDCKRDSMPKSEANPNETTHPSERHFPLPIRRMTGNSAKERGTVLCTVFRTCSYFWCSVVLPPWFPFFHILTQTVILWVPVYIFIYPIEILLVFLSKKKEKRSGPHEASLLLRAVLVSGCTMPPLSRRVMFV